MTKLSEKSTRTRFETAAEVHSRGRRRPITVTATPKFCVIRLAGTRQEFPVLWEAIHDLAAKQEANRARAERLAAKGTKKAGAR